jgi:hypothetical protein
VPSTGSRHERAHRGEQSFGCTHLRHHEDAGEERHYWKKQSDLLPRSCEVDSPTGDDRACGHCASKHLHRTQNATTSRSTKAPTAMTSTTAEGTAAAYAPTIAGSGSLGRMVG